jgi:two-component system, response regulator, stage 0 sporulation protein F
MRVLAMRLNVVRQGSILIVDSELGTRVSLKYIFKSGYHVYSVSNGHQAINFLQGQDIDVVILDLRVLGVGGIRILRTIKESKPDIEIVIITAFITRKNIQEAIRYGAGDFIPKPFDVAEAVDIVNQSLVRRRHNSKIRDLLQARRF